MVAHEPLPRGERRVTTIKEPDGELFCCERNQLFRGEGKIVSRMRLRPVLDRRGDGVLSKLLLTSYIVSVIFKFIILAKTGRKRTEADIHSISLFIIGKHINFILSYSLPH
jgi:hypothetical protein